MKMAAMKYGLALACITCCVQPVAAQSRAARSGSGTTFRFDVKGTRLTGHIVKKMFPGPPNFDSIKSGDEPQEHWVLRPVKPITVVADPKDEFSQTERNVSEIQLVLDEKGYKKYRPFLGKRQLVTISCSLFNRHTRYHHTAVLANVLPPPVVARAATPQLRKVRFSRNQRTSAQAALNAARRLESAVNVGLTYADYSRRLVDAQVIVDEKLRAVPASDFKTELQAAMKGFVTARFWWEQSIEMSRPNSDAMSNQFETMTKDMWRISARRIRNAEKLLS